MPATAAVMTIPQPWQPVRPMGRPAVIADHEGPLIRRAQAGDPNAHGELYSRYEPSVHRYLLSRLPDRAADAEDLVAETFLTAMQRIGTFQLDRPGEFGNWLIGIAHNKSLSWHKREVKREEALIQRLAAAAESAAAVSPEEIVLDRLEVADGLSRLTPRAQRALVLQHVADKPCAEVALALGTTKRSLLALTGWARSELRGEVRRCACGCGATIRPERWGRDRYASLTCPRPAPSVPARVLCACGCGAELPAVRAHNRLYATRSCRNRAAWRRRKEAQRRYLAGPVAADPAVEQVLAVVREADGEGMTRGELSRRTRLLAVRLDRAIDWLASRWQITGVLEPSDGCLVVRYRALTGAITRRAA